jgi:hypothetical protein
VCRGAACQTAQQHRTTGTIALHLVIESSWRIIRESRGIVLDALDKQTDTLLILIGESF